MNWHRPAQVFRKPRQAKEHKFQRAVSRFLSIALPLDAYWSSIDHAGGGLRLGANRKSRGVKAGLPDVIVLWQKGAYFLELKDEDGVVSDDQRACHQAIMRAGGKVGIAKDLSDVQFWLADQWHMPLRAVVDPRSITGARSIA